MARPDSSRSPLQHPESETGLSSLAARWYAQRARLRRVAAAVGSGLLLSLGSTGCATIFSSSSQQITITSNVEGADVLLDGQPMGKTPLRFELDRDTFEKPRITVRSRGYRTEQFPVSKTINKVALLNCTSIFSWGTDALTGAMMEYSPDAYYVELRQNGRRAGADRTRQATWFVVMNRKPLLSDIARGNGQYLRALGDLYGLTDGEFQAFGQKLRARLPEMLREEYPHRLLGYVDTALVAVRDETGSAPSALSL
jgi:hypothetical protein